ncbi:MAG: autotransporter-associated beta strand repeat-containing protein [Tepidisphaeraceae bacterium]
MTRRTHARLTVAALSTVLLSNSAFAQVSGTWSVAGSGNWSTAGNWTGGVPNAGGAATFGSPPATGPVTVTLDIGPTLSGLTFNGTNAYTIAGVNPLNLTLPRTITVNAGTHTISAPLGGSNGLTKAGVGTLVLNGNSTIFTGNTAVNAGVLRVATSDSLGPAGPNNQLGMAFGGSVELNSGVNLGTRSVTFASSAASTPTGALRSLTGPTSSGGAWYLLAGSSVGVDAGSTLKHTGDLIDNSAGVSSGLTKVGAGTLVVNRFGGVNVPSGGGSVQQPLSNLAISAGVARVAPATGGANSNASRVKGLLISGGALLDLTDGPLVYDYTGASPITTVRDDLKAGRLTSSMLPAGVSLGFSEVSGLSGFTGTVAGQTGVDPTALVVKRTRSGDANLDGAVNFSDLLVLAANYNTGSAVWSGGDFDYDGTVNFSDLLVLAANYNQSFASGALAVDWAAARSSVPEPASALIAGLTVLCLRRRGR